MVQATAFAQAKHDSVAARYEITGVVLNSVTGSPVPRCRLTASLSGSQAGAGERVEGSATASSLPERTASIAMRVAIL